MPEGVPLYLRYRVINRVTGAEITSDLPHLHKSTWEVMAMQPGNPGSSALGSFTIPLYPPGTEQYDAAKAIYDQLDYYLRVEGYASHTGLSIGGPPTVAGFIIGIRRAWGNGENVFELTGVTDLALANYSKPFPGEYLYLKYGSGSSTAATYRQARHYFGTNEAGWMDNFNPYTSGNYTSTNAPGGGAGTWSSTTDDGLNVVSCATGSGAVLIASSGAAAGDIAHRQFVEVAGRLKPSSDATNAGQAGVGITSNSGNVNNGILLFIQAKKNGGRWDLNAGIEQYSAGVGSQPGSAVNVLTSVDDPEGYIPFSLQLSLVGNDQITAQGTVNGQVAFAVPGITTNFDPGTSTCYPFLYFGAPASGSATVYHANLVQQIRFVDDGNANVAVYKPGTVGSPNHSLPINSSPPPTFLEVWTQAATREGWYWRYTPQTYVSGTRTIGTVDFATDPGTDHSLGSANSAILFDRAIGNLLLLELVGNADQFVSGTLTAGPPSSDGGGIAYWRDVSSITKYGVIDDQTLAGIAPNFALLRSAARQIVANKVALSAAGAKRAIVLRDPTTVGQWRELDKITINDPELGINYLTARVVGYDLTEGDITQVVWLDQFSADDETLPARRFQQAAFQVALGYKSR